MEATVLEVSFDSGPVGDGGQDDLHAFIAERLVEGMDLEILHTHVVKAFNQDRLQGVRDQRVRRDGSTEPCWRPWTLAELKLIATQPEVQNLVEELRAELRAQADEAAAEAQRERARFAGLVKRAKAEREKSSLLMAEVLELRRVVRELTIRMDQVYTMGVVEYETNLPEDGEF